MASMQPQSWNEYNTLYSYMFPDIPWIVTKDSIRNDGRFPYLLLRNFVFYLSYPLDNYSELSYTAITDVRISVF